jgi:hypothetical protein
MVFFSFFYSIFSKSEIFSQRGFSQIWRKRNRKNILAKSSPPTPQWSEVKWSLVWYPNSLRGWLSQVYLIWCQWSLGRFGFWGSFNNLCLNFVNYTILSLLELSLSYSTGPFFSPPPFIIIIIIIIITIIIIIISIITIIIIIIIIIWLI